MQQQIDHLATKVRELESRNYELQTQVQNWQANADRANAQLQASQRDFDNERAVTVALRETMVQRDNTVSELTTSLDMERDAHRITLSERDDARHVISDRDNELSNVRQGLEVATANVNEWRNKAIDLEGENASLKQRLERITAILSHPQSVGYPSADVA